MTTPVTVELFVIGNELLIGEILDTNTHWLCRELNRLGGMVTRVTVLRDDAAIIGAEIKAALGRAPRVIITSGGLGPTADDLTLAAIASGLELELKSDTTALEMIRQRYDELTENGSLTQGGLNPARAKMANLPAGGRPLHNPDGTAPAVLLPCGGSTIISLPGVPSELKAIFTTSLQPFLQQTFHCGLSLLRTLTVQCNDESLMEPVLSRVASEHREVYIKSLATTINETREIDITLATSGDDPAHLQFRLQTALVALQSGLTELGFAHREKEEAHSITQGV